MKIIVNRILLGDSATIGELIVDNKYLCDTLEDKVRPVKVYGKTAIPAGTYTIKLTYSPRFRRITPEILNVPNFKGIRIHAGNTSKDTEGCLLVGNWDGVNPNWISNSRKNYNKLFTLLQKAANNKEDITITINNSYDI